MTTLQHAFTQAFALEAAGRRAEAASIYLQILAMVPNHPGALLKLAEADLAENRVEPAHARLVVALEAAQRAGLPAGRIWLALGEVETARHDATAAETAFARALELAPDDVRTLIAHGRFLMGEHRPAAAESSFRRAALQDSGSAPARANLALALAAQQRWDEANVAARESVAVPAAPPHAFQVAAYVALKSGDAAQAVAIAEEALRRFPDDHELVLRAADCLLAARRSAAARVLLEASLVRAPDDARLRAGLGAVLLRVGDPVRAREQLSLATRSGLAPATAWDNLGVAERALGNHEAAIQAFESALRADPRLVPAATNLMRAQQEVCAWPNVESEWNRWRTLLDAPDAGPRCDPFVGLGLPTSPAQQLAIARRWSRDTLPPVAPAVIAARGERLRLGYLGGDFHAHATAYLMAGLFECHGRRRIDVGVYSYGPDDDSPVRRRMRTAVDSWTEVAALDDAAAARRIRDDCIDVLVDLKGHTEGARLGILAHRPAPLQLHYLGFPGTLGSDAIDGVVADDIVVPESDEQYFHERVLRLPRCYQVNDRHRELPEPLPRSALGLPERAVVLACFNQTYKLTREFFGIWLETLRAVPQAVLWLYVPLPLARRNLLEEVERAGIAPSRIVFAERVDQATHIARLRTADLSLDVLPYGSHTSGSDALWSGVPLLSCRGTTFAGRVGASLLHGVGLDELVTESPAAYRSALIALAGDRDRLRAYRDHLHRGRRDFPLFDTPGFTRDWEHLLLAACDAAARHSG
jgi:protein O-GlcNAc transferase